jgi:hypothetical protein
LWTGGCISIAVAAADKEKARKSFSIVRAVACGLNGDMETTLQHFTYKTGVSYGVCGAAFSVACKMIHGRPSRPAVGERRSWPVAN